MTSKWGSIDGSLFAGRFVAYIDRTKLSVALPGLSQNRGFAGLAARVLSPAE